jgi:hypothetical protein
MLTCIENTWAKLANVSQLNWIGLYCQENASSNQGQLIKNKSAVEKVRVKSIRRAKQLPNLFMQFREIGVDGFPKPIQSLLYLVRLPAGE